MKYGMRTPSPRRSFKARTTDKWKRQAKKALIPGYGKKGMGWVRNPRKAMYTTRSTGRPRSASGTCSSKTKMSSDPAGIFSYPRSSLLVGRSIAVKVVI